MSEYDALDAMVERIAREEDDDIALAHGEHILHMWKEGQRHREEQTRSLLDTIGRAHEAKAQESDNA
jgi:hypothetical protein